MADEGTPIAYTALSPGTPVQDRAGRRFGTVERVLDVPDLDVFDGIVVRTEHGSRLVDADLVEQITTTYVRCSIGPEQTATLPEPQAAPVFRADASDDTGNSLLDRLGRLFGRGRWKQER
jgi:hypothetical protein